MVCHIDCIKFIMNLTYVFCLQNVCNNDSKTYYFHCVFLATYYTSVLQYTLLFVLCSNGLGNLNQVVDLMTFKTLKWIVFFYIDILSDPKMAGIAIYGTPALIFKSPHPCYCFHLNVSAQLNSNSDFFYRLISYKGMLSNCVFNEFEIPWHKL